MTGAILMGIDFYLRGDGRAFWVMAALTFSVTAASLILFGKER